MKRFMILLVATMLLATIFAGCTQGDSATVENEPKAETKTEGKTTETKEEATAAPVETKTIRFVNAGSNKNEIFTEVVNVFNESQSEVFVDFTTNTQNYGAQLKTQLVTGDGPDICTHLDGRSMIPYVEAGYLRPLTNEPILEKISPSAFPSLSYKDEVYGIPLEAQTWGIFYNMDIMNELDLELPKTLSEFENVAKTISDNGRTAFASAYMTTWTLRQLFARGCSALVSPMVHADPEGYDNGDFTYDIEGIRSTLKAVDIVKKYSTEKAANTDLSGEYAMFATGEAAMMAQGSWSMLQLSELNPELNATLYPMPISENPDDLAIPAKYLPLFVVNNEGNMDAVCKFLDFFIDPNGEASFYFDRVGSPTAIIGMENELLPMIENVAELVKNGQSVPAHDVQMFSGMTTELDALMQEYMLSDDMTHDELIAKVNEVYNDYRMK